MSTTDAFVIPAADGVDQIEVFVRNAEPGRGSLTVTCWGRAWTAWWGAMGGGATVQQFIARVDADYVANCLVRGAMERISTARNAKFEEQYVRKIAAAVVGAMKPAATPDANERGRA